VASAIGAAADAGGKYSSGGTVSMSRKQVRPAAGRATTRTRQAAQIRRFVVLDFLRGPAIPFAAGALGFVVWVASNAELLAARSAVTFAGGLALLVGLHLTIRDFFSEKTPIVRAAVVGAFAIAWAFLAFYPFYDAVNPPTPLLQTELRPSAPPTTVPLHGAAGRFRVIVEGHFPPKAGESHKAGYRISVGQGEKTAEIVEGEFSESWTRRRLGRRGSVQAPIMHSVAQHMVESAAGEDFTLHLDEIGTEAQDSVTVSVYSSTFPAGVFVALEFGLVGVALVLDAWRGGKDGAVTTGTIAAFLAVAAFRYFASPRPGFGDLVVFGGAGTLAGALLGNLIWRVARKPILRLA
jgi:nitrate reductase NapE component